MDIHIISGSGKWQLSLERVGQMLTTYQKERGQARTSSELTSQHLLSRHCWHNHLNVSCVFGLPKWTGKFLRAGDCMEDIDARVSRSCLNDA